MDSYGGYRDDMSGGRLDPAAVISARDEELSFIRSYNVYVKVPIEESYRETGKGPVSTTWLDANKGDAVHPNIRSRFVAREIAHERDSAMFAATPPLEANKLLYSLATTEGVGYNEGDREGGMCLMFIDIKRASVLRPGGQCTCNFHQRTMRKECAGDCLSRYTVLGMQPGTGKKSIRVIWNQSGSFAVSQPFCILA